ncbi:MAG TPA: glycosyltransferase family 4 protein [Terracidiphilus sp.]|nr:glycosyltransferase family 4 protein [Terracidiphilus sp.]
MIYHILPEMEPFCDSRGGAISKNVANIMHFDGSRVVVCQNADDSWGYSADRIVVIDALRHYAKVKGRRNLPLWVTGPFFRHAFKPLIQRLNPGDLVWCHNQPFFAAALEENIRAKDARLVYHCHDPIAPPAVRAAFRSFKADAYVYVSEALRQRWLTLFPGLTNTYVVHNGADDKRFYPIPKAPSQDSIPVILYVGRIHPEKGVHFLVEAIRILERRSVAVHCRVVGSSFSGGSKKTRYVKDLIRNSPRSIEFRGYRAARSIAEEFQQADICCCPSVYLEAFGNVNIEAMACGVPVVATRVGGIPEIASDGGVLLVDPGSAEQIADALESLVRDRTLRQRVAAEGLASYRRRFTWAVAVEHYAHIAASLTNTDLHYATLTAVGG